MAIRWEPDTCGCKIEYDSDLKNPKFIDICVEHEGMTVFDVIEHNRDFNKRYSDITDKKEKRKLINKDKVNEKLRIKKMKNK